MVNNYVQWYATLEAIIKQILHILQGKKFNNKLLELEYYVFSSSSVLGSPSQTSFGPQSQRATRYHASTEHTASKHESWHLIG